MVEQEKMKALAIGLFIAAAFGLMGMMGGCEGKAPVVHSCKAYADEPTCSADELCKWKQGADGAYKCKAK